MSRFRIFFKLILVSFLGACSGTVIVPGEVKMLKITDLTDNDHSTTVEISDPPEICRIQLLVNESRPVPAKFRSNFRLMFVSETGNTTVGINSRCVMKEGNTFCNDVDVESVIVETIRNLTKPSR